MSAQASQLDSRRSKWVTGIRLRYVVWLMVCAALVWLGLLVTDKLQDPATLPITKIRVKGEMKYVTEAMLQKSLTGMLNTGFFSVDVQGIQQNINALPWVDHVSVRRIWPETLALHVVEQQPLAIWKAGGIVNLRGELFKPENHERLNGLPVWQGPEDSQQLMKEKYRDISEMLAPLNLKITELTMARRHAVRVKLDNDVILVLGRKEQLVRLQRFIDVYPKIIAQKVKQIDMVDLRYSNGMSIRWNHDATGMQQSSRWLEGNKGELDV